MILSQEDADLLVSMLIINAPEDTGNLKHNAILAAQPISNGWIVEIGGPNAPYAPFIKLKGTHNQILNPWIEDTLNEWARLMTQKYGGVVNATINR